MVCFHLAGIWRLAIQRDDPRIGGSTGPEPEPADAASRDPIRRRHDAVNLLMVIDLACESLLQRLSPTDPLRDDIEQIAEARSRLLLYFEAGESPGHAINPSFKA